MVELVHIRSDQHITQRPVDCFWKSEIGMRKVLGAPIHNIVSHFAWQSTKPVIWANLLAWPIAW